MATLWSPFFILESVLLFGKVLNFVKFSASTFLYTPADLRISKFIYYFVSFNPVYAALCPLVSVSVLTVGVPPATDCRSPRNCLSNR